MSDKQVTYTITVDPDLFPFAPGSTVLVRDESNQIWHKTIFGCKRPRDYPFACGHACWKQCIPFDAHAHLLDTSYAANTPACPNCKKALPDCICKKEGIAQTECADKWDDTAHLLRGVNWLAENMESSACPFDLGFEVSEDCTKEFCAGTREQGQAKCWIKAAIAETRWHQITIQKE